ncbi:MAG: cysteine synthase A [Candidatus Cryptobacteroides sp.]|nr:cysteine synthase A [Bacteroidales bacterium]MDY2859886.1 cysteine synthase A [Candidatus Cryptobacteroides sp.]MDY5496101.1 cysteine synthase A [Candidatus Cryptobacteroides sp.]
MIHRNITELIGRTPLVEISGLEGQKARIAVKVESFNPGGSVKDRIALSMIEDAEARGVLAPGATIIEPTSGNTGVGLAWIGRVKGYKVILTMPETMSRERRSLLKAYGAELVLTPGTEGMKGAIRKAEELRAATPGAIILGQFVNPANPVAHEKYTGEEIWNDTEGQVDIFIAGAGTGGTVSGTGRALKRHKPEVRIIAVEPAGSPVLTEGHAGPHKIQGIGAGFVPDTLDRSVVDEVLTVADEAAFEGMRLLSRREGILAGISSGAAFSAALEVARREENAGKLVVALLPDTGERYLSTGLFE